MNVIINNCKQTTRIVTNLLKSGGDLSRCYATSISDYNITWVRPKEVSPMTPEKSGDQGVKVDVKPTDLPSMYSKSPEMKDASDIVKKMFSYRFLPLVILTRARRDKVLDMVKRYELDRVSPEALIGLLTGEILQMQQYLVKHPRNKRAKSYLLELIAKRRKYLKHLRTWDYKCFEWTLEKLNLVYKPIPSPPLQITRKESLTRLTEKHCNELVQGKLNTYKKELQELQKNFYIEKAKKLAFIREEELACGLQPSVSEEDIECAEQKAQEYQT